MAGLLVDVHRVGVLEEEIKSLGHFLTSSSNIPPPSFTFTCTQSNFGRIKSSTLAFQIDSIEPGCLVGTSSQLINGLTRATLPANEHHVDRRQTNHLARLVNAADIDPWGHRDIVTSGQTSSSNTNSS